MTHTAKICKSFWGLIIVIALFFVGCQKTPTWQEQYDLGMLYLTESNYEEAILAFTTAIEIAPKQADAYIQLEKIYREIGDEAAAERIRAQGYELTGDERLTPLETAPTDQSATTVVFPTLAEGVTSFSFVFDGSTPFEARPSYCPFEQLEPEEQDEVEYLIELVQRQDGENLRALLDEKQPPYEFCTQMRDYKLKIMVFDLEAYQSYLNQYYKTREQLGIQEERVEIASLDKSVFVEIRQQNSSGISYGWGKNWSVVSEDAVPGMDFDVWQTGSCQDWQYQGEYEQNTQETAAVNVSSAAQYDIHIVGQAENNHFASDIVTIRVEDGTGSAFVFQYQDGWMAEACVVMNDQSVNILPFIQDDSRRLQSGTGNVMLSWVEYW